MGKVKSRLQQLCEFDLSEATASDLNLYHMDDIYESSRLTLFHKIVMYGHSFGHDIDEYFDSVVHALKIGADPNLFTGHGHGYHIFQLIASPDSSMIMNINDVHLVKLTEILIEHDAEISYIDMPSRTGETLREKIMKSDDASAVLKFVKLMNGNSRKGSENENVRR